MLKFPYENPPIVEAILDLRVKFKDAFVLSQFDSFKTSIADEFPIALPIHLMEVTMQSDSGDGQSLPKASEPTQVGIRLSNNLNNRVLQLQQGGFTFSHLAPYSNWESMRDEAKSLWKIFCETSPPFVVTRCAVRFINRISIPKSKIEPAEYFKLYPTIPKDIHQNIVGMLLQLQMPQPDLGESVAVINMALVQPEKPLHTTILLDIDLSSTIGEVEPTSLNIWDAFELFRERKNTLFESLITTKSRRLFK
ncbi:TIGR04255 family protein [Undibacterium sp.]|uniref:TIGR04255 family protein n=1 Tax=Undibacterium sp. TaxID=1914977 RepID=UPI00374CEFB2